MDNKESILCSFKLQVFHPKSNLMGQIRYQQYHVAIASLEDSLSY